MELITERLLINKFTEDDLEAWFFIESNFEVRKYIDQRILNLDEAQSYIRNSIQSYINKGYGRYAVRDKTNNKLLGMCGFLLDGMEIDFGYRYCPSAWGNGIGSEAANIVFEFGINTLDLKPIIAGVHPENYASEKIIRNLGFRFVSEVPFKGKLYHKYEFSY